MWVCVLELSKREGKLFTLHLYLFKRMGISLFFFFRRRFKWFGNINSRYLTALVFFFLSVYLSADLLWHCIICASHHVVLNEILLLIHWDWVYVLNESLSLSAWLSSFCCEHVIQKNQSFCTTCIAKLICKNNDRFLKRIRQIENTQLVGPVLLCLASQDTLTYNAVNGIVHAC